MVSGLVTSPYDQPRMIYGDASLSLMASKSVVLMFSDWKKDISVVV